MVTKVRNDNGGVRILNPVEELWFMHQVWTDSRYHPNEVAFRIRAVVLARIECKLYHKGETG